MAYTKITKIAIDDKLLDVDAVVEQAVNQRMGNIIDIIHPVGDTIIRLDNINPATLYAGTTWELVSQGKAIIGANTSYPLGSEGGSADAVVVSHTHTQNAHNHTQNAHTHTQNPHNHAQNAHTHIQNSHNHAQNAHYHRYDDNTFEFLRTEYNSDIAVNANKRALPAQATNGVRFVYTDGNGTIGEIQHTPATTATNQPATATNQSTTATNQPATAVNQSTTATNNPVTAVNQTTGVSGVGKNMMPYKAFNIWLRTA